MTGTTTVPTLTTAPAPTPTAPGIRPTTPPIEPTPLEPAPTHAPTPTAIRPTTPPAEPPAPEPTPTVPHQRQALGRLRTDSPTATPTAPTAPTVPLAPADAPANRPRTAAARTRTTGVRATQAGTTATDRRTAPHPDRLGTTTSQGRPADIRHPAPGAAPTTGPQPSATAPTGPVGPAGPPDATDHIKLTDSTAPTGGLTGAPTGSPTGPSTPLTRRPPRRPTGGPGRAPDRTRRPAAPAITTRTTPGRTTPDRPATGTPVPDRTAPARPAPSGPRPAGPRPSGPRLTRPAAGAAYAPAPAYTPGDTYPDRTTRDRPTALTDIAAATAAAGRRPDAGGAPLPTVGARRRAHEHRPHHWFAHQLLLTLSGQRPVHALLGHALPAAYDRLVELAPQAPLRPATGPGRRAPAPSVRDCGLCRPRGGVIEAFARIAAGERLRALAFRLELGADSRWRCAALDIGPTCAVRGPVG
ncbi:Rv3235 family protein [Streptomyces celluloflavus]|uniref:Rv3235 family protein n=1 Tax=Streptomyces celluloflavus TaxID=58344 RepID=UPI0036B65C6E